MNKTLVGIIFIVAGLTYGSFAVDAVYTHTLGWLVQHNWVKPPPIAQNDGQKNLLGRKTTILLYGGILIIIGLFILWNRNS